MTINTLFGPEEVPAKRKSIRFKQIKAIYETLTIKEEISNYLGQGAKFTSPIQIFNTFNFLINETKEYFYTVHLDTKNRLICIDQVSIGSQSQAIVHPREVYKTALLSSAS